MTARRLADLLAGIDFSIVAGDAARAVTGIRVDSRQVEPGDVFVCLPGYRSEGGETRADRHDYIGAAIERGAVALVVDREIPHPSGAVTIVRIDDGWAAIAAMSCAFFDHPSREVTAVGVTGTSGKTSTTYFLESVLRAAGRVPGCFGTIDYRFGGRSIPAHQTTPEAPELQRLLREAVDAGCDALVMEVSSHALQLRRVAGVAFDVAVFTNISQDHLNFHPDMDHYLRAKGRLFEELGSSGKAATAVVNLDDASSSYIREVNRGALLTFGVTTRADVRALDPRSSLAGTSFRAATPHGEIEVRLPHLGEYQVYNALAAIAAGVALDLDIEAIRAGMEGAPPIPGRFEWVESGQEFRVAVDYAHKPDALERLLRSARALNPRRLITVFGCGGDRDRGKRPIMGRVAAEGSDVTIVTSDNPRSEDPERIIDEIAAGASSVAGAEVCRETDRAAAIDRAIQMAEPGDLVLIAGKGHETYQLFADRRIDFDDRQQARRALAARR